MKLGGQGKRDAEIGSRRRGKGLSSGGSRGGARGGGPPLFLDQTRARRPKKMCWETAPPLSKGLDDRPPPYLKVWIRHSSPSPLFLLCLSPCPALTSFLELPLTVFDRYFYKRNISRATPRIGLSFFNHFLVSLYNTDSFIRRTHNCRLQRVFLSHKRPDSTR